MRQGVTTCSVIALWGTGAAREGGVRHGRRKAREAKKRQSMQSGTRSAFAPAIGLISNLLRFHSRYYRNETVLL